MRYITESEVHEYGSMSDTIRVLEEAFMDYASGESSFSSRIRLPFPGGTYITMPGVLPRYGLAGLKTYVGNRKGIRHVMVFSTESSEPVALIEASRLGQLKTGGLPAMVSRRLLGNGSRRFCLVGSGMQADAQLEGILSVFELESVSVFSRDPRHAERFASVASMKYGIDIKHFDTARAALKDADLISTITSATGPIFTRDDLGDRYHVNLCGANIPTRREVDDSVLSGSDLVVVEHMEQAMSESSEIIEFRKSRPDARCVELKDVMFDAPSDAKRIVFKSMGVGLEDVAAAAALLRNMDII